MVFFLSALAVLLAGGTLCLLFRGASRSILLIIVVAAASLLVVFPAVLSVARGTSVVWALASGPAERVLFAIDPLSAFFVILISLFSLLTSLFMAGALPPYDIAGRSAGTHPFFFCLFVVSMLAVVTSRNAIVFLAAWELMSFSSFFLIVLENEKKEVFQAGINYMVTMQIGAFLLFAGFLALITRTGSADMSVWGPALSSGSVFSVLTFVSLAAGFGLKAGLVPFHSWLPHAHPAAPGHISAIMSGVMIKTGIYGILRLLTLSQPLPFWVCIAFITIASVSAVWGVLQALGQHDLKRLLAYCSIENIGIIGLGIGFGMLGNATANPLMSVLGYSGAVLHVFNHAVFKSLLFFGSAAVYQVCHTRDMEKLGGLGKLMPVTATGFLIGSAAISGLPPLNGFISEFLIFLAMLKGLSPLHPLHSLISLLAMTALVLTGALASACFVKAFSVVFLGKPRSSHVPAEPSEVPVIMLIPMMLLTLFCFLPVFFPHIILAALTSIVQALSAGQALGAAGSVLPLLAGLNNAALFFTGLFLLLGLLRQLLIRLNGSTRGKVWACGYRAGTQRMQYTSSSFVRPLLGLFKPAAAYSVKRTTPEAPYSPIPPAVTSGTRDIVEDGVISPATSGLRKLFGKFSWIQSGRTQDYLIYGIIFLVILIALGLWIRP